MSVPTYEQLLDGETFWTKRHRGFNYRIRYKGYRPPNPEGREHDEIEGFPGYWFAYLTVKEQSFPNRWEDFAHKPSSGVGKAWDSISEDCTNGGIMVSYEESYYCDWTKRDWKAVRVGWDYNHLWDGEQNYPSGLERISFDAKCLIDGLLYENPDCLRPDWKLQKWLVLRDDSHLSVKKALEPELVR